jgi:hypothetical protein
MFKAFFVDRLMACLTAVKLDQAGVVQAQHSARGDKPAAAITAFDLQRLNAAKLKRERKGTKRGRDSLSSFDNNPCKR